MAMSNQIDKERGARLVAKYRAIRESRPLQGNANEILQRFGNEVFGTEAGYQVLIEYLREHGDPRLFEDEEFGAENNNSAPDGR